MSIIFEERPSDSPYVETVTHGWTISDGAPIRPAEINWHIVVIRQYGETTLTIVGPWTASGTMTKSLKQFIGFTPNQLVNRSRNQCKSQDISSRNN